MSPDRFRLLAGPSLVLVASLALVLPARSAGVWEEPDWSKITFKVQKLSDTVYLLEGAGGFAGGNVAVSAGPDGVLVIDAAFEPMGKKLKAAVHKLSRRPIRYVVNTHFHGDHTSGNTLLGPAATIIAHDRTRERLVAQGFRPEVPVPPRALPVITVNSGITLHLNGEAIRATHPERAHTDTDLVIRFEKSNVVHLGDLFFNGFYPFIDLDNGGSVRGTVAAIEQVLADLPPDAKVIPGHGPLGTRADLEAYLAMIKDCVALVQAGIAQNRSLASLRTAKLLAKYDAEWGDGLITTDEFLAHLYRELAPPKAR
jgi:glyoxylase-like metal-dependent hydrolase (beta-lactamase superfamily II)